MSTPIKICRDAWAIKSTGELVKNYEGKPRVYDTKHEAQQSADTFAGGIAKVVRVRVTLEEIVS